MGNAPTKALQRKGKKNVHWSNADCPTPPGKPQLVPGTPLNQPDVVTIKWDVPAHDGGAPILGYLVEHRRTGSPHWVRATPALVQTNSLTLSGLEPGWRYQFRVSAENAAGISEPGELSEPLTVTLNRSAAAAPHFTQELKDTTVLENEKAEFCVHFRGTPTPQIAWFKDGFEIFSSRRTKIVTENNQSTLVIFQAAFNDEGEVKCTATNRVGHVVSKVKLRLEAPPRIRLPRQYEDGLLFEMDEIIRLKVSVAGRPLPRVTWHHDGDPIVFGGRHEITNTERSSSLRVGEARREDRGEYQVRATSRLGEDSVSVLVTVTDRPLPPGKAKVDMTLGRSVTLSWTKPDDDGGCKIGNYLVEYYRLGWNVWLKAATCRQLTTTLGDLIEGSEYKFRVKAENPYGVSDPSEESAVVFIPDPKRGLLEAPARGSTVIEAPPEQPKDDGKKRPLSSPDPSKSKRDRHSDSSMEYPSSDADSDSRLKGKNVDTKTQVRRYQDLPKQKEQMRTSPLIPLTVMEHDNAKGEQATAKRKTIAPSDTKKTNEKSITPETKRRREKENMSKLGNSESSSKPKQLSPSQMKKSEAKSVPKSSVVGQVKKTKSKEDDYRGLSPEVFSLKIPVAVKRKSEEPELPPPPPPRKPQELPREEDDSLLHGSSEMMLVLLPQTRDDQIQTDRERGESFSRSLEEGYSLGVAPPMSLSAPELGSAEPPEMPALRNAISSTELLHEKTMARFFLEAAAEEVAQNMAASRRRSSLERRHSLENRSEVLSARNKPRLTTVAEKSLERVDKITRKKSPVEEELLWHQKKASPEQVRRNDGSKLKSSQLTEEEQEELDFARLREKIAKTLEEDFKAVENEMVYMKRKSPKHDDDDEEEEEDEEEDEEGEEEDEEEVDDEEIDEEEVEEEEEDLEDEELTEESTEESEGDVEEEDDDTYSPRGRQIGKGQQPLRSMEQKRFSDDDEEEPYHPRAMVPRAIPPPVPAHREILTVMTMNDTSKSTPPVRFEPKTDLQPKPILKTSSKFENENGTANSKSQSPRASTPFSADEKKAGKKPIINKILGKIEAPFKKLKSPAVDSTSSDVVVRRKKKDPQPESTSKLPAQEAESREGDLGLSAAEIARKRRLQTRQTSLEEDSEANKILISHYSDIVKEYGSSRKESPTLFLSTEQLKAAAEGYAADSDISISPEPKPMPDKFRQFQTRSQKEVNAAQKEVKAAEKETKPANSRVIVSKPIPVKHRHQPPPITPPPISPPPETPSPPMIQDGPYQDDLSEEEESSKEEPIGQWEFTPRHMIARIRRSLTPKHSFRRQRSRVVETDEEIVKKAETRVQHFIGYLTDLAMFMVACWLYLFKDERLAIPVLLLMVYRQMHEAILSWVPKRWRRTT